MITLDFEADDTDGIAPFTTIFHGYIFYDTISIYNDSDFLAFNNEDILEF
jgi:hypothetical protein